MPHRFDWRTGGNVSMQFCRDCGLPGIVTEHGECPGPPDGAPADYLAPVQRGAHVVYRNGVGRIEIEIDPEDPPELDPSSGRAGTPS